MEFSDDYDHWWPSLLYTPECIPTKEMEEEFNQQFSEGCNCDERCTIENQCACILKSGAIYTPGTIYEDIHEYTIQIIDPNKPIYECNTQCRCYNKCCGNRLVQLGPRKHLKIQDYGSAKESHKTRMQDNNSRSDHTKGLGLITTENMKRSQFVCEYAGELITRTEATKRHAYNDTHNLMNYIFCMNERFGEKTVTTFIDPSKFGNVGRYLNHSCEPNCELKMIRVNHVIPKLCIFTAQDIEKNSELTFDYGIESQSESSRRLIKCLCCSSKCRKYMPFTEYVK